MLQFTSFSGVNRS